MGTRADFYTRRPDESELVWLGSIAWDGYPDGIDDDVLKAATEEEYIKALDAFTSTRDDYTAPERGWPWPWADSCTTDYGYVFVPDLGVVHNCFGHGWVLATDEEGEDDEEPNYIDLPGVTYPDMSARKKVRLDQGSGVIFISTKGAQ